MSKTNKEEERKLIDEFWNEHDGTHFYKDEFIDLLTSLRAKDREDYQTRIVQEIEKFTEYGGVLGKTKLWNEYNRALHIAIEIIKSNSPSIGEIK